MAANPNADVEAAAMRMISPKAPAPAAAGPEVNPNAPPGGNQYNNPPKNDQKQRKDGQGQQGNNQGNQNNNPPRNDDQKRKDGQGQQGNNQGNQNNNPPRNDDQKRKDGQGQQGNNQNRADQQPPRKDFQNKAERPPAPAAPAQAPVKPLQLDQPPVPDFGDNVEKEMDGRISTYFDNLTKKTHRYKDEIRNLRSQVKSMKGLMDKLALGYKVSVEAVVQVSTLIRHYQELIDGIQIMFEDLDKTPLIQPSDFNEIKKLTDMNMVRIQKQFRDQVNQIAELYTKTGNTQAAADIKAFDRDIIGTLSISAQQLVAPGQPYGVAPVQGGPVALRGGAGAAASRQHVYVRGPQGMLRIATSFKRRFQLFASQLKRQNRRKKVSA